MLHINLLALVIPSTSQVSFGFKTFQGWWHILSSVRKIQTCEDSQRGAACVGLTSQYAANAELIPQSAISLPFCCFLMFLFTVLGLGTWCRKRGHCLRLEARFLQARLKKDVFGTLEVHETVQRLGERGALCDPDCRM